MAGNLEQARGLGNQANGYRASFDCSGTGNNKARENSISARVWRKPTTCRSAQTNGRLYVYCSLETDSKTCPSESTPAHKWRLSAIRMCRFAELKRIRRSLKGTFTFRIVSFGKIFDRNFNLRPF